MIMMKQVRQGMVVLVILGAAMMAGEARGSIIEFTFGGNIFFTNGTPPAPWDGISVGSIFSVSYVFDSEEPDQAGPFWIGRYDILQARITIDGITQTTTSGEIVLNLANSPVIEIYQARFFDIPDGMFGQIKLTTALFLDSDALLTDINLDDWFLGRSFEFGQPGGGFESAGLITTFSSRIVPAPGILVSLTLMGVAFRRTRKRF